MVDIVNTLLTGGVAVALIGVASQVLLWWLNNRNRSKPPVVLEGVPLQHFDGLIEVQQIMERVLDKTGAQRFLILKTENGGGKPRLGSHLYASVMYEAISNPMVSVKNDYQRLLVDNIYVKMLSDIGPSTPNKLIRDNMKEGILKRIYTKEKVAYSEIHYLSETDNAFFYLSIATSKDDRFNGPIDRVEIEIAISKLVNIFEKIVEGKE